MSELLLIQTPYIDDYGPMKKAAGTYFPLGLGYISAYVKQHCYDTKLIDPNVQGICLDGIAQVVLQNKPLIVGISFMTPQIEKARKICRHIRQVAPEICIVLGGAHPTAVPKQTLQYIPEADIAVIGEGERTTLELLRVISQGKSAFEKVPGLCFHRNGQLISTNPRDPIENLDTLPFPDRNLIDQRLYHTQSFLNCSRRSATIYTSRGCPGRCVFCCSGHRLRSKVRERSIDNVMAEIDWLVENRQIDYLLIKDDTFTFRRSRVEEFCELISLKHPRLRWHCMGRVNTVNYELLAKMKKAGLRDIFFGLESGDSDILKRARKGTTLDQGRQAIEDCNKLGIRTYGAFILGLPGESKESIERTIHFACSLPLTMSGFSILTPYPGTYVYEKHYHSDSTDYHDFIASSGVHYVDGYTGMDNLSPAELPSLVSEAQKRFYRRPKQIFRMLRYSNPSLLLGYCKGFMALLLKERTLKCLRAAK